MTWCPKCGRDEHTGRCVEQCPLGHAEHLHMPCMARGFSKVENVRPADGGRE